MPITTDAQLVLDDCIPAASDALHIVSHSPPNAYVCKARGMLWIFPTSGGVLVAPLDTLDGDLAADPD